MKTKPQSPWYARAATTAGRPIVLTATLVMSMPGEYHVAKFAGWTDPWAYGMPLSLSAYAGIAAVVAATRRKGARGRASATIGAGLAIVLALAAQVVAHLVTTGHMDHDQAWLIAVTSMVPPAVLAHLLHLAATPTDGPSTSVNGAELTAVMERVSPPPPVPPVPPRPKQAPQQQPLPAVSQQAIAPPTPAPTPPAPAPAQQPTPRQPIIYSDPRCAAIRPLYANGTRPGTAAMRAAILDAGHGNASDGKIRGDLRAEIERHEPELAQFPPAIGHTA
ncbi:hypothetical protein ACFV3N_16745 [Streptomyces bauhiniae]|uniref:hypothetical protein n=1 Tax=Streptomyces bauhiniae TaxID=2340725 RepID=UPI0036577A9F